MNVYNEAHNLAKAIRESEEYKQYEGIKKKVADNAQMTEMLNEFQSKQFEMQARMMMGDTVAPDVNVQIQELYNIMMKDPLTAQYLQCEIRFSMMMNDVYKILGEIIGVKVPGQGI